jgi:hypothetical protein
MFAPAYSGFPVELSGVGVLHAAFLNESRTRGCWWGPRAGTGYMGRKRILPMFSLHAQGTLVLGRTLSGSKKRFCDRDETLAIRIKDCDGIRKPQPEVEKGDLPRLPRTYLRTRFRASWRGGKK